MKKNSTIDLQEVAKFKAHSDEWWNPNGPLKTLHDINPVRLEFVKKYVDLAGAQVLDVGCGGGIFSEGMARLNAQVTGLDVEPESINSARAHALESAYAIEYVCQPIEAFKHKSFDVVTCMEMLEHVADPTMVIENCARLLKHDGYLFLSTINRTPIAYATAIIAAEYVLALLPRQTHDYKKFIKPSELATMTRQAGLETVAIMGMGYNPLTRRGALQQSVAVNYLMVCRKM